MHCLASHALHCTRRMSAEGIGRSEHLRLSRKPARGDSLCCAATPEVPAKVSTGLLLAAGQSECWEHPHAHLRTTCNCAASARFLPTSSASRGTRNGSIGCSPAERKGEPDLGDLGWSGRQHSTCVGLKAATHQIHFGIPSLHNQRTQHLNRWQGWQPQHVVQASARQVCLPCNEAPAAQH